MYTVYIDESDTHGDKPDMVMAAFVGTPRQWELLNRRLRKIRKEFGFKTFHATGFKHREGDFKGWSDEKRDSLIVRLTALVRDELTEGIVTRFPHELYQAEYKDKLPPKMHKSSQYGLAFLATLERTLGVLPQTRGKHCLRVVAEEGHTNAQDLKRIFEERKDRYARFAGGEVLTEFQFGTKKNDPELMLADFLAHMGAMDFRRGAVGLPVYSEMTQQQPRKKESGLTTQVITPEWLKANIDEFEKDKRVKQEEYLKQKQARLEAQKKENDVKPDAA
jgi:hypothetical protein